MEHTRSIRADELLDVLRDLARCGEQIDPWGCVGSLDLGSDTTIAEWATYTLNATQDLQGRQTCREIKRWFESVATVSMTDEEWRYSLRNAKHRTIRELCVEVSPRARLPEIRAVEILGSRCLPAGVFRHFENAARKWKRDRFGPSTLLRDLEFQTLGILTFEAARLAPGMMPLVQTIFERDDRVTRFVFRAGVSLAMIACIAWLVLPQVGGLAFAISSGATLFSCSIRLLKTYSHLAGECRIVLGEFETVADVCRAIAERQKLIIRRY